MQPSLERDVSILLNRTRLQAERFKEALREKGDELKSFIDLDEDTVGDDGRRISFNHGIPDPSNPYLTWE